MTQMLPVTIMLKDHINVEIFDREKSVLGTVSNIHPVKPENVRLFKMFSSNKV